MSAIDELLAANERYAAGFSGPLSAPPAKQVAVVACMDARLDVAAVLGLAEGDAHVIRNAGGVITDDVVRSLVVSQRALGTREVMLIHHTRCGMQGLDEEQFLRDLEAETGQRPSWAVGGFADVEADVRESIARVRRSPFLPHTDAVRGFIFDVADGRLHEVTD